MTSPEFPHGDGLQLRGSQSRTEYSDDSLSDVGEGGEVEESVEEEEKFEQEYSEPASYRT